MIRVTINSGRPFACEARSFALSVVSIVALVAFTGSAAAASDRVPTRVSDAQRDERGVLIHRVTSEYEAGTTAIHVLLPTEFNADERYDVLYVLPVEAGEAKRWGDALGEILKHNLHNKHTLVCVMPTFSHLPWYADHPDDAHIRQESYLLKVVLPFVDKTYPTNASTDGRLLIGFSKSGWGAFSLLLRHPKTFGRAAAWDAPLMMDSPSKYGMREIFATQENFEPYRISALLEQSADELAGAPRLAVLGYGNFRQHHQDVHELMTRLQIPHVYHDGPQRKHSWDSGWVAEAVEFLNGGAGE